MERSFKRSGMEKGCNDENYQQYDFYLNGPKFQSNNFYNHDLNYSNNEEKKTFFLYRIKKKLF